MLGGRKLAMIRERLAGVRDLDAASAWQPLDQGTEAATLLMAFSIPVQLVPQPMGITTRPIAIDVPPEAVWPWILQIGAPPRGVRPPPCPAHHPGAHGCAGTAAVRPAAPGRT